jgi:hypothetical protein
MSRYLPVILVSTLCFVACSTPRAPGIAPAANHFSLVLEHSAQGWRATCDVGCRWREVTMSCGGCEVRLTSIGVGPASSFEPEDATFAFTLSDAGSGWEAKSGRGVYWLGLSHSCPQTTCRARMDEAGVRDLDM